MTDKLIGMRINDAIGAYLDRRAKRLAVGSILTMGQNLALMPRVFGGHAWLTAVTADAVEEAFCDEEGPILRRRDGRPEPKANSTINKIRSHWLTFFAYAARKRWQTAVDPMGLVDRLDHNDRDWIRLDMGEMIRVIDEARFPTHRVVMQLQASAGRRIGEASSVTLGDLALHKGYFMSRVRKTKQFVSKAISLELDQEIRKWLVQYALLVDGPLHDNYPLTPAIQFERWHRGPDGGVETGHFFSLRGTTLTPMTTGSEMVKDALVRAGFDEPGQASHVFRRSAGRLFYDKCVREGRSGEDALEAAQRFLDHKDPRTTLLYIGAGRGVETVDRMLRGKPFITMDTTNVLHLPARAVQRG